MSDETMVSADRARGMLEGLMRGEYPLETELQREEPDWNDIVSKAEGAIACAAVPHLLRTVIALRAIIEGRATPPTDAELAAHDGAWLMRLYNGALVAMRSDGAREARGVMVRDVPYVAHWIATTSDGRPCAWPVAPQRPAGCICDFRGGLHRFSCLRQQPTLAVTRGEDGTFRVAGTEVDRGE